MDPSTHYNEAIQLASLSKSGEMIQLLLNDPRVDPTVRRNYPLRK